MAIKFKLKTRLLQEAELHARSEAILAACERQRRRKSQLLILNQLSARGPDWGTSLVLMLLFILITESVIQTSESWFVKAEKFHSKYTLRRLTYGALMFCGLNVFKKM